MNKFQLSINQLKLELQVQNLLDSGKVVNYKMVKGRSIDIANSSMSLRNEKEGCLYGDPVLKGVKKTRKFV